jgi:hypothetical protein
MCNYTESLKHSTQAKKKHLGQNTQYFSMPLLLSPPAAAPRLHQPHSPLFFVPVVDAPHLSAPPPAHSPRRRLVLRRPPPSQRREALGVLWHPRWTHPRDVVPLLLGRYRLSEAGHVGPLEQGIHDVASNTRRPSRFRCGPGAGQTLRFSICLLWPFGRQRECTILSDVLDVLLYSWTLQAPAAGLMVLLSLGLH